LIVAAVAVTGMMRGLAAEGALAASLPLLDRSSVHEDAQSTSTARRVQVRAGRTGQCRRTEAALQFLSTSPLFLYYFAFEDIIFIDDI
jgi:hypothetical protein